MKERGIIMSAPMVKALLDGRKTQTRRIVKKPFLSDSGELIYKRLHYKFSEPKSYREERVKFEEVCPYGVVGDRLWAITIKPLSNPRYGAGDDGNIYRIDKPLPTKMRSAPNGKGYQTLTLCENGKRKTELVHLLVCRAFYGEKPAIYDEARHLDGDQSNNAATNLDWGTRRQNWSDRRFKGRGVRAKHHAAKITEDQAAEIRNSVFSQRVLAKKFGLSQSTVGLIKQGNIWNPIPPQYEPPNFERWKPITLEITGVRVERLQDISNEDAIAEGLTPGSYPRAAGNEGPPLPMGTSWAAPGFNTFYHTSMAAEAYHTLWDSLHGKGAWELNPWVWVLEFKKL